MEDKSTPPSCSPTNGLFEIEFKVPGLPVALKRPRMTKRGIVYDPSKKEKQIFAIRCNKYKPPKTWKGPI